MKILKKISKVFRSAITGRFVSKKHAGDNPGTTISSKRKK